MPHNHVSPLPHHQSRILRGEDWDSQASQHVSIIEPRLAILKGPVINLLQVTLDSQPGSSDDIQQECPVISQEYDMEEEESIVYLPHCKRI
jgi:hypothetical protein